MELGDSVYAAERIMKKRIRKVSVINCAGTLDKNCETCMRDHISPDFIGVLYFVSCMCRNVSLTACFACTEFQNMLE